MSTNLPPGGTPHPGVDPHELALQIVGAAQSVALRTVEASCSGSATVDLDPAAEWADTLRDEVAYYEGMSAALSSAAEEVGKVLPADVAAHFDRLGEHLRAVLAFAERVAAVRSDAPAAEVLPGSDLVHAFTPPPPTEPHDPGPLPEAYTGPAGKVVTIPVAPNVALRVSGSPDTGDVLIGVRTADTAAVVALDGDKADRLCAAVVAATPVPYRPVHTRGR